jgi:hypothetical protein
LYKSVTAPLRLLGETVHQLISEECIRPTTDRQGAKIPLGKKNVFDAAYCRLYGVERADAETMLRRLPTPGWRPKTNADRGRVYGRPEVQAKWF